MNILFTVESYYPLKNGVQEITQRYAEYLASRGNIVTVITGSIAGLANEETINGVHVIRINIRTKKSIYFGDIDGYRSFIKKIVSNYDIMINVCTQTVFTDVLLPILKDITCKKLLYLHGIAHFSYPNVPKVDIHDILSWILNVVRWRYFYWINRNKFKEYDAAIHLHFKDNSIKIFGNLIKNNYILENCAFYTKKTTYSSKIGNDYLMIANYIHDKNQEMALRAYVKSNSVKKLVFVGSCETPYLKKLNELYYKLKKRNPSKCVEFVVGETHEKTMNRLRESFALIHSSKSEKYPVVLCEAQMFSKPFICTDTGICRYLPGGMISTNVSEMANMIDSLEFNTSLYNKLSVESKDYSSRNQDFAVNCKRLENIIKGIISK